MTACPPSRRALRYQRVDQIPTNSMPSTRTSVASTQAVPAR